MAEEEAASPQAWLPVPLLRPKSLPAVASAPQWQEVKPRRALPPLEPVRLPAEAFPPAAQPLAPVVRQVPACGSSLR